MIEANELTSPDSQKSSPSVVLAQVLRLHGGTLLQHANRLTGGYDDAWDLLQEALLRALDRGTHGVPVDKILNWLLVVMGNLYVDHYRKAKRRRQVPFEEATLTLPPAPVEPEAQSWEVIDYEQVVGCLSRLKPVFREAYELHAQQGLSLAATAQRLSVPTSTAGTRVMRARRDLRALLEAGR